MGNRSNLISLAYQVLLSFAKLNLLAREKITNYLRGSSFFEEFSKCMGRIACGDNVIYEKNFFIFESLFKSLLKRVFVSYHGSLVFISS